jgi:hypothetical protein
LSPLILLLTQQPDLHARLPEFHAFRVHAFEHAPDIHALLEAGSQLFNIRPSQVLHVQVRARMEMHADGLPAA